PDPFQDARQPRVSGAEVVGNTSPSRQIAAQRDSEVTQTTGQASSEYDYRTVARSAEQSANGFVPSSASQPGHRNLSSARRATGIPMDHAPDYRWLQGQLEYSAIGGGRWKLRYAPLSADDEHGGSVILESNPGDRGFQSGDMVYVEGQIVSGNQPGALRNP